MFSNKFTLWVDNGLRYKLDNAFLDEFFDVSPMFWGLFSTAVMIGLMLEVSLTSTELSSRLAPKLSWTEFDYLDFANGILDFLFLRSKELLKRLSISKSWLFRFCNTTFWLDANKDLSDFF